LSGRIWQMEAFALVVRASCPRHGIICKQLM